MKVKISNLKKIIKEAIASTVSIVLDDDGTKLILSGDHARKYADASEWKYEDFRQFLKKHAIDYINVENKGYRINKDWIYPDQYSRRKFLKKLASLDKPHSEYPPNRVINTLSHQRFAEKPINFQESTLKNFIKKVLKETPSSVAFDSSYPGSKLGPIHPNTTEEEKYAVYIIKINDNLYKAQNSVNQTIATGTSERDVSLKAKKAGYELVRRTPYGTNSAFYDNLAGLVGE